MGPALMFDKSAFESIARDLHGSLLFRFHHNNPPVLLREILGDLAKDTDARGRKPDELVASLSAKFCGGGGTISEDWRVLCMASVTGGDVPMTGQIIPAGYSEHELDGQLVGYIAPTEENDAIIRWAHANFMEGERLKAEKLRREAHAFNMGTLRGRLAKVDVPRAKSINQISALTDRFLDDQANYPIVVHWLVDQLRGLEFDPTRMPFDIPGARIVAVEQWKASGGRPFREIAPYAYHCARALLMLLIGDGVLSAKPTNRTDVEYLLYLPFCHLFVSNDKLHWQLAPALLRPYQSLSNLRHFLEDVKQLKSDRDSADRKVWRRRDFAFGQRPWPRPGSVLWAVWEKTYGPWDPPEIDRGDRLPVDEQVLALKEGEALVAAARATPVPLIL